MSTHKCTYNDCADTIALFMNSRDMLNQQKQEMAQCVPDPSPCRGWGLGMRLDAHWNE